MSKATVLRVLKDFKMHPYVLRMRQEITKEDCASRLAFCEEMLELVDADASFRLVVGESPTLHYEPSSFPESHSLDG